MASKDMRNAGNGGETHQRAEGDAPILTTNHGVPISDNQNSLKSGARGPTLLEDFVLREKIFHFDHERKVGGAKLSDGSQQKADGQLAGTPSQIFDAVAIVLSEAGCAALLKEGAAVEFVMNAYGHLKAVGATEAAKPLLDKAGVVPDAGVTGLDKSFIPAASQRFYAREPSLRTLA